MLCSVMFNLSLGRFPEQIGSHVITGSGSPVAEQLTVTFVYKNKNNSLLYIEGSENNY